MVINAKIEKKISKKSGAEYICIVLEFPNGYKKVVFPDSHAEQYLLAQLIK